jgi:hypothetical protein
LAFISILLSLKISFIVQSVHFTYLNVNLNFSCSFPFYPCPFILYSFSLYSIPITVLEP